MWSTQGHSHPHAANSNHVRHGGLLYRRLLHTLQMRQAETFSVCVGRKVRKAMFACYMVTGVCMCVCMCDRMRFRSGLRAY